VHRIGRTGRAGASGKAYSLVCADEIKQLNDIEQLIQRHLPREYIDGFEPEHEVPASAPLRKPRQPGRRPPKHSGGGSNAGKHTAKGRAGEGHKRPRRRRPRAGSGNRA